jgi:TolB-like protein
MVRLFALLLLSMVAAPPLARAEGARRVAVLPLVAGQADLRIYSKPIADELASSLRGRLDIAVATTTDAASVPANVDLVIDGQITRVGRRIRVEARVRDPATGRLVGAASSRRRPLEQIDVAARELAGDLGEIVARWRRARAPQPYRLREAVVEIDGGPRPAAPPLLVVMPARGRAAGGTIAVERQGTEAALAFVERLGVRFAASPGQSRERGAVAAANAVRASKARYALALEIESVTFNFRGVLSARGQAAVRLIDRNGVVVFHQPVSTDTVVGSRGDRHTALVYAVAEQALDIAAPRLRRALAR